MSRPLVVSIPHRLGTKHFAVSKTAWAAPVRTLVMCSRSRSKSGPDLTCSIGSARLAKWQAAQSMWPRTTFDWRCFCHGSWRSLPKHCSR